MLYYIDKALSQIFDLNFAFENKTMSENLQCRAESLHNPTKDETKHHRNVVHV